MSPSSASSFTRKRFPDSNLTLTLIPGLPNDLAGLILSSIPYSHHARLKPTSKSWKIFFSSKTLISLRQKSKLSLSHLICIFPQDPSISSPYLFDPQNLAWCPLPPMPCNPHVKSSDLRLSPLQHAVTHVLCIYVGVVARYDMSSNRWWRETTVPRNATDESSIGFVASDGELHILSRLSGIDSTESRRSRQNKRSATLFVQIYNPRRKTWRSLITKPPFSHPLDLKTSVMCIIQLQN